MSRRATQGATADEALSAVVQTRLTERQRELVERAAARDGKVFVSSWVRAVLVERLEQEYGARAVGREGGSGA